MSERIPAALIRMVRRRAGDVCEYCLLPQGSQEAAFHVDHIRPRVAGGKTVATNLALACVTCSLKKGARTHARDPVSKQPVPLFHPRHDRWADQFRWTRGCRVAGRTQTGRATVRPYGMNRPMIVSIRKGLIELGQMFIDIRHN